MTNPYGQMTAGERLRFALWLQEAEKQNTKMLKELMVEQGPIRIGTRTRASTLLHRANEKRFYPYQDGVSILDEWFATHPDERPCEKSSRFLVSLPRSSRKARRTCAKAGRDRDVRVETELKIGRKQGMAVRSEGHENSDADFENFRSHQKTVLDLDRFNFVRGTNGCGKSSFKWHWSICSPVAAT